MNINQKGFAPIIIALIILVLAGVGGTSYYLINKQFPKQIACTMDAKICPDGSSVGRTGPNCEFTACPAVQDSTANWLTETNTEYGFTVKYPSDFSTENRAPKIIVGNCNYSVFPNACPNINNIVMNDMAAAGGDINILKQNFSSPNYWNVPSGEKLTINNTSYCLYQTNDAAMGHTYNYYYYTTVVNNKCLVVNFATSITNCNNYLPLENGNTEQAKNYNNCLTTNANLPTLLNQIISTFKFNNISTHAGIIEKAYQKDGKEYIDINLVKFVGDGYVYGENDEEGNCNPKLMPDPYCVVDSDKTIKSYIVASDAVVIPAMHPGKPIPYFCKDYISNEIKDYAYINDSCKNGGIRTIDGLQSPYFVITMENNIIKEIKEIYIP